MPLRYKRGQVREGRWAYDESLVGKDVLYLFEVIFLLPDGGAICLKHLDDDEPAQAYRFDKNGWGFDNCDDDRPWFYLTCVSRERPIYF